MAADPKPDGAEVAPKSKKKLIIMIAAVVLLAGGGGAGWFLTHQKLDHKKEEAKHEEPAHAPVFVTLEAFTVNLQPDPDEKFLQTEISLQVASPEQEELMKAQMPAVRSRLLILLTSKTASEISTSEGKQKLSDEIVAEVNKPFSKGAKSQEVTGVFFTSFVIQ
ncbi:flagellar basal body-associated protein FliL [Methylotenera sp.]|uniref:flagellar basal body-associated protein FliL n=1 Tax=Methylotenera sp. TaxID=2051956 RepID=UPI002488428A|nr:flagellar basal body-associated protein FliL [Methylotenera sp.]MDI1361367.1 flagellar basal body-associated protein FliL [Methylotenera sp.]